MAAGFGLTCPSSCWGPTMTSLVEPMSDDPGLVMNLCSQLPQLLTWDEFRGQTRLNVYIV